MEKVIYPSKENVIPLKPMVEVFFFLLLFTFLINRVFHIGINIYLSDFIVISSIALTVIQLIVEDRLFRGKRLVPLFMLLFIYYLVLVFYAYALQGNSINDVLGRFRNLFFYPLLFFTGMVFTREAADMKRKLDLIRIYIVSAVLIGMVGVVYPTIRLAKIYAREESGAAVVEPLYYMIVAHGTALLCCFMVIHELLELLANPQKKLKSMSFIFIGFVGIIGTQNRSIYIVFLVSIFLIAWFGRKSEKAIKARVKKTVLLLFLLLIGLIIVLLQSPFREKIQGRIDETIHTITGEKYFFQTIAGVRVGRTITTFKEWLKSPILGCGWGNQITRFDIYDFQGNYIRTNYGTSHNYYMTILYQTGIIGFIIMLSIFYLIFKRLKPQDKLNSRNTMEYTLYIYYIIFLIFNLANTHLYSHPVFIPLNFFLLGAGVSYFERTKTGNFPKGD